MTVTASTGIVSGLDTSSIISKLMAVETAPLTSLQSKLTTVESQVSALGKVKSAIASLQDAAEAMSTASDLYTYTGTVANTSVASVTTSTSAVAGTYSLEVQQLATSEKLKSAGGVDASSGGTLTISIGSYDSATNKFTATAATTTPITISSGATLSDVATAINKANVGLSASVISGTDGDQLVVTSNATGESNRIRIESTISGLGYDPTSSTNDMTEVTPAQNAIVLVDGITLKNTTSNTITDGVSGLTIKLTGTNTGSATSITVSNSTSGIKDKLQAFVDAYNSARSTLKTLSQYDSTGSSTGVLNGDSTITSALSQLRGLLSTAPSDASSSYQYLSQLGVTAASDGTLSLDTDKLSTAMDSDFASVAQSVAAYGSAFSTLTTNMNSTDGLITNRITGLTNSKDDLNDRIDAMKKMLEVVQKRYETQFAALETILSSLQTTSTYLTQQLSALNSSSSG